MICVSRRTKNVENKRSYVQHTQILKIKARTVNKANLLDVVNDQLFDMGSDIEVLEINGSGYAIKQFNIIFIEASTIKPPRGSSYIPTPEPFNNARCGLINIQNDDLKCFEWCMKYHQTKLEKHDGRVGVLVVYMCGFWLSAFIRP